MYTACTSTPMARAHTRIRARACARSSGTGQVRRPRCRRWRGGRHVMGRDPRASRRARVYQERVPRAAVCVCVCVCVWVGGYGRVGGWGVRPYVSSGPSVRPRVVVGGSGVPVAYRMRTSAARERDACVCWRTARRTARRAATTDSGGTAAAGVGAAGAGWLTTGVAVVSLAWTRAINASSSSGNMWPVHPQPRCQCALWRLSLP
jgi:hypothetical protein